MRLVALSSFRSGARRECQTEQLAAGLCDRRTRGRGACTKSSFRGDLVEMRALVMHSFTEFIGWWSADNHRSACGRRSGDAVTLLCANCATGGGSTPGSTLD
jgi:hypothetical protein